ncbi:hypothetical protein ACIBD9_21145 [Micromonospora sp. NPDC050784]|uniref:hypothetical protein n=1 Tax=Micromonospora sp. NPDC050784 TaxID=3364281 RepID=UPI0037A6200E
MGGLIDLVDAWFAGRPTENLELFGVAMVLWGRLGKSMLYLAGLTVVLDLPDPEQLKEWGQRTIERADGPLGRTRRKREVRRLLKLQANVLKDVVRTTTIVSPGQALAYVRLVNKPPDAVPVGLNVALATYRDFHSQVMATIPDAHTCGGRHEVDVCPQQQAYARSRINALIGSQLPADERNLVLDMERSDSGCLVVLGASGVLVGLVAFTAGFTNKGASWTYPGLVLAVIATIISFPTLRLLVSAAPYRVWGALLSGYGGLLNQTRPFRLLRWAAAVLFAIGGLFDLLAS